MNQILSNDTGVRPEVDRVGLESAAAIEDFQSKLNRLEMLLIELQQRVEDLEYHSRNANPIPYITPNSTTAGIIERVNHIITYLNEGIRRD